MDAIKREVFEAWVKANNWFKVNEVATPRGKQDHYISPAGEIIIIQYNLKGKLAQVIKPMPPQPQPSLMPKLDLKNG